MDRRRFIAAALAAPALAARTAAGDEAALARLGEPGVHAIMRHALAPGTGDPAEFRIGDCATQRNLDARGRAQARATGAALEEAGARFDRVPTSQWCRCRETARLLDLGPVEDAPALNSFFRNREDGPEQTQALKDLLAEAPRQETLMLVTHQVNITALLGTGVTSGEVFVFRASPEPEILGTFLVRP